MLINTIPTITSFAPAIAQAKEIMNINFNDGLNCCCLSENHKIPKA